MYLLQSTITDYTSIATLIIVFITLCLVIWILAINKIRWEAERDDYREFEINERLTERIDDKDAYIGYLEAYLDNIKHIAKDEDAIIAVQKIHEEFHDLQDEYEYIARREGNKDRDRYGKPTE